MTGVRGMTDADAAEVLAIYQQGIDTGHATFQAQAPPWEVWSAGHLAVPRLVAEPGPEGRLLAGSMAQRGSLLGWAALSAVSARAVYSGVAEVSIYIAGHARGRGVGQRLLAALIEHAEQVGIWTLQAGIFPENEVSIALHHQHGFRTLGYRQRIGRMTYGPLAGQWRDVAFLERRSTRVGLD